MDFTSFFGPKWFAGPDLYIDLFSALVLALIAITAWKFYKINKNNKNQKNMFIAMSFLAASLIFKVITYFSVYLTTYKVNMFHIADEVVYQLQAYNNIYVALFLVHAILGVIGLFILFSILVKLEHKSLMLFSIYLLVLSIFLSASAYTSFHLTSFILSIAIAIFYFQNYKKNKLEVTKLISASFFIISASQALFLMIGLHNVLYVLAEFVQLIGYILLLISLTMVLKHAKKKR